MYIKVSDRRVINASQITDAEDLPPGDETEERALIIHMSSGSTIALGGEEAEVLLAALPVYTPVAEE